MKRQDLLYLYGDLVHRANQSGGSGAPSRWQPLRRRFLEVSMSQPTTQEVIASKDKSNLHTNWHL